MAVPPFKVRALYDYTSQEEDDLRFKSNQIITVMEEEDVDWYYGEYEDDSGSKQEGLFPKNFIKVLEPEAPPRPSRGHRPKKDNGPPTQATAARRLGTENSISVSDPSPTASIVKAAAASASTETEQPAAVSSQPAEASTQPPPISNVLKSSKSVTAKPTPPAVEKPSSNAFRDRINAFNKSAAAPIAPMKPGNLGGTGGSNFVKKAFVAPPPSKNAYFSPPREATQPRFHGKGDDPAMKPQKDTSNAEQQPLSNVAGADHEREVEDLKPTSLKDRIAILQKQQMEQAARQAEVAVKPEITRNPRTSQEIDEEASDADEGNQPRQQPVRGETANSRRSGEMRRRQQSNEQTPNDMEEVSQNGGYMSDGDDADQSGAGDTEEGEEVAMRSGEKDLTQETRRAALRSSGDIPTVDHSLSPVEEISSQTSQQDDIDPELRRRMEIRDRMAKMSGGMGMAGMFAPAGGFPNRPAIRQPSNEVKKSGLAALSAENSSIKTSHVPRLPPSEFQKIQIPEQMMIEADTHASKGGSGHGLANDVRPGSQSASEEPSSLPRRSTDQQEGSLDRQVRPVPPPHPPALTAKASSAPIQEPDPPSPSTRPSPLPPRQLLSPSEGSVSDDELSSHEQKFAEDSSGASSQQELSQNARKAPIATSKQPASSAIPEVSTHSEKRIEQSPSVERSPPSAPAFSVPPPPPSMPAPSGAAPPGRLSKRHSESDEEITEYEGDYDTDIAPEAAHKNALRAHARRSGREDDSATEEMSFHHSGLPSLGPPVSGPPRAIPPPPPPPIQSQKTRKSLETPSRPTPPLPPLLSPKQKVSEDATEYDPYKYDSPVRGGPSPHIETNTAPSGSRGFALDNNLSSSPSSHHARTPSLDQTHSQFQHTSGLAIVGGLDTRQSSDVHRTSATIRRSADVSRQSDEHHMATNIDLEDGRGWWAQHHLPPPSLQGRADVIFEIDESTTNRRGGKISVMKDIYVLYMDYSQTIISVEFERSDPNDVTRLEQRHESPPRTPRQDQLEEAHRQHGIRLAESAKSREGMIASDGTPQGFVSDMVSSIAGALPPVGNRAYGALVYANLANATVQQHDEIRPGDIISFRNAKFGGHKGPMKSKYSHEVGKPDHVGIVLDWDGSKKKVRAWEQGRESKKVKAESFRFGDLKSGEVKVWRLMNRAWVGWDGNG